MIKARNIWLLLAATLLASGAAAAVDSYPTKPIQLVVPFPPGGNIDLSARLIAQPLSEALGQSVVVENRPGAGGTIGAAGVSRSKADGYTLLVAGSTVSIAPFVYKNVGYDPEKNLTAIGGIQTVPMVLTAAKKVPVSNLAELRSYVAAHPGNVTVATSGNGSAPHLALEEFMIGAKLQLTHVPYRGGAPALSDLLGGHVNLMVDQLNTSLPYIQDGRIKAIAQLGKDRSTLIPNVPTLAEQGVNGYDVKTYVGLFGPAGLPPETEKKLVQALAGVLARPEIKKQFADMGATVFQMSQPEFIKFVKTDIEKSRKLTQAAKISVE